MVRTPRCDPARAADCRRRHDRTRLGDLDAAGFLGVGRMDRAGAALGAASARRLVTKIRIQTASKGELIV